MKLKPKIVKFIVIHTLIINITLKVCGSNTLHLK